MKYDLDFFLLCFAISGSKVMYSQPSHCLLFYWDWYEDIYTLQSLWKEIFQFHRCNWGQTQ